MLTPTFHHFSSDITCFYSQIIYQIGMNWLEKHLISLIWLLKTRSCMMNHTPLQPLGLREPNKVSGRRGVWFIILELAVVHTRWGNRDDVNLVLNILMGNMLQENLRPADVMDASWFQWARSCSLNWCRKETCYQLKSLHSSHGHLDLTNVMRGDTTIVHICG